MRLFVALDIEDEIRNRIRLFMEEVRHLAPDVRWATAESLHVTLKFIGEQPDAMLKQIESSLEAVKVERFTVRFSGVGFFPTVRAARVFWIGIDADARLGALAGMIDEALAKHGIAKENRAYSPHLTLARSRGSGAPGWRRGDKPNRQFRQLQEFLEQNPAPEFGAMKAQEYFLYRSQLSPKGSRYTKIARFELMAGKIE